LLAALAREGQAVLLVSHNLNLVARFAQRIVLLESGRVVASGTPTDVMRPETLERVYGWPIAVAADPTTGTPTLIPLRSSSPGQPCPPITASASRSCVDRRASCGDRTP